MEISIAVILFQIGIFLIMTYAAYKGIWYLNVLTIIIILFTLYNVKTSPLMIIQFFTVFLSYTFCLNRIEANKYPSIPRKKYLIELIFILILNTSILGFIAYGWIWFTLFYFENYSNWYEEWFLNTLGVISYIIMLGFAFMIIGLIYGSLEKNLKDFINRF